MRGQFTSVLLPYADRVIVCLETAADMMLYSNGVVEETLFRVFAVEPIDSCDVVVEIISKEEFEAKECIKIDGLSCTTFRQTVLDLLAYDVDLQVLLETLSNYYYCFGESFDSITNAFNDVQRKVFEMYRQDAIDYYVEE